jgi:hypothetical protein
MPKLLTPDVLRRIILEEKERLLRESDPFMDGISDVEKVEAEEVEPEDLADTLAKEIDHIKALKIKESKLVNEVRAVREAQNILRKRVLKKLS